MCQMQDVCPSVIHICKLRCLSYIFLIEKLAFQFSKYFRNISEVFMSFWCFKFYILSIILLIPLKWFLRCSFYFSIFCFLEKSSKYHVTFPDLYDSNYTYIKKVCDDIIENEQETAVWVARCIFYSLHRFGIVF